MAVTIRAGADPHGPQRATEHEQPGPARRARHQGFQLSRSMRPRQPSGLVPWHRRWEPSVVAPVEVEPVRSTRPARWPASRPPWRSSWPPRSPSRGGSAAAYFVFVCVGSAAVIVITMIRNRHDHVLATPDGLVVVTRRGRAVHPWTDTLEVGWMSPLPVFPPQRPGVVIRPAAASSWAVPGPNARLAPRPSRCTADAGVDAPATCWRGSAPGTVSRSPPTGSRCSSTRRREVPTGWRPRATDGERSTTTTA